MPKRVEIIEEKEVFKQAIFRIDAAQLRHEKYNGEMTDVITRLNFNRGDSVAILVHDADNAQLIMTEQFRYPAHKAGDEGWLIELPAGSVERGETPENTVRREVTEEIGYRIDTIEHISTFFVSPGGTSERILLYYARVAPDNQIAEGGGEASEGEFIRVLHLPVAEAIAMCNDGRICDAKTILGIQWMQLQGKIGN